MGEKYMRKKNSGFINVKILIVIGILAIAGITSATAISYKGKKEAEDVKQAVVQSENKSVDAIDSESQKQDNSSTDEIEKEAVVEEQTVEEVAEEPAKELSEESTDDLKIEDIYVGTKDQADIIWQEDKALSAIIDKPTVHYTIAGEEHEIDCDPNGIYFFMDGYNMGYQLADVTGDGRDDLIVSEYVYGNTYSDLLQNTYVYEIDDTLKDLKQIFYIGAEDGGQYAGEYCENLGWFFEDDQSFLKFGTKIEMDADGMPTFRVVRVAMTYDGSNWSAGAPESCEIN